MANNPTANELSKYTGSYSKSRLWSKLASAAKRLGKKTTYYVLLLYYTLQSGNVSVQNKAIIIGALGYLIFPFDLIPDFIPVVGFTDDAAAIMAAYKTVKASITPDIERKASDKMCQWFESDE